MIMKGSIEVYLFIHIIHFISNKCHAERKTYIFRYFETMPNCGEYPKVYK